MLVSLGRVVAVTTTTQSPRACRLRLAVPQACLALSNDHAWARTLSHTLGVSRSNGRHQHLLDLLSACSVPATPIVQEGGDGQGKRGGGALSEDEVAAAIACQGYASRRLPNVTLLQVEGSHHQ